MRSRTIPLFFLFIFLTSCGVTGTPTPAVPPTILPTSTEVPTATLEATSTSEPSPIPTPAPADLPSPKYTLSAVLDVPAHSVAVSERIVYPNRSQDELNELLLMVEAAIYPGGFLPGAIASAQGPAVGEASWDGTILRLKLTGPLHPGQTITLDLGYTLYLPARIENPDLRPMVYGWSERQINLVDWYPFVAPYVSGQGWLAHSPGFYGEHQVYEASDFEVQLQLANAASTWRVAASAPGEELDGWQRYELQGARAFVLSASPDYLVQSRQVGDTTITAYTFPLHAAAGERVLQVAADAMEVFSNLFGAYSHSSLAVVEADFLDGMEYSGLFFLSKGFYNLSNGTPADYLVALAAHETAHQWWFDRVGNDQALQPWLDEALCTYSERLYYERLHPEALEWWWTYRVNYYEPRGPVDDTIYNPRREVQAYRAYRDAVYLNGAVFLEELRSLIGDPAFFAFLADYADRFDGQIATTAGFFDLLKQHTSADIQPLGERYFGEEYLH